MKKVSVSTAVATALLMSIAPVVGAEESDLDIGRFVLSGYGDVTYIDQDLGNSNIASRFVPIFLFQLSEKIHIESELEFSIDENGETEVEMEYADIHYFSNDNTTITAGKFLLPFGQFGPNLHPSWINKLPSMPGVYGHHGNSSLAPLLPILSDTGFNIRNSFNIGSAKLFTDFYIVTGPRIEAGHGEEEAGHDEGIEFPEVDFAYASGDNNDNKAMGGRIALAFLPQWEVGYSFYQGAYDDGGNLDFSASSIDFNWIGTYANVRGEIINTTTDGLHEDGDIEKFDRDGWYVQGTWQMRQLDKDWLNPIELVVRRSKITEFNGGERWTVGINYWLEPSAALKLAYEETKLDDGDTDNRLFVQIAFGF